VSGAAPSATWEVWLATFQEVYPGLPESVSQAMCPECGTPDLNLRFIGRPKDRVAYALFWCSSLLTGIHISQVDVPEGVDIIPLGSDIDEDIPNFKLAPHF
jgi:hypothetical protein